MYTSTSYKSYADAEHNPADYGTGSCDDMSVSDLECQTILKQRKELQLLIGELKDRDRELNEMVSAHRQQLTAWEKDRSRVTSLEKRNAKLETEVRKRNEQLRLLVHRLKLSESNHNSKNSVLETTQTQLMAAQKAVDQSSILQQDLQNSNDKLNDSINEMAEHIERLEAKEQDFVTQLQLKNGELVEAESEISDLHNKLRRCEAGIKEIEEQGSTARNDLEQQRNKFRQCRAELDKITSEMATKTGEVIALRQELSKLREEVQKLRKELYLSEEQMKRRDEVIQLHKSKQQRSDSELAQLRQLYERQQDELAVLQVNLENSQGLLAKQEEKLNQLNVNQLDLDRLECCSQTTSDLLEEARKTAEDSSFLYMSSSPRSTAYHYKGPCPSTSHDPYVNEHRTRSPNLPATNTSKLQQLLNESKQMAQDLERTAHARTSSYY